MTEAGSSDYSEIRDEGGARRLLCLRLRWDDRGSPESLVLVYALKSEGYPDGEGSPRHRRRTEPFLREWQGAMTHWASRNCQTRFEGTSRRWEARSGTGSSRRTE